VRNIASTGKTGVVVDAVRNEVEPAQVLVVEDFGQLREMLVDGLTKAGFAVEGAASVRQALGLRPEAYAVLVVDHRLGDAFGTDLFRELYDRDESVASRFILMTADAHRVELPTGVLILVKPFRLAVLVDAVRQIAASSCGGR
jgi:DNA-binding response OmpR family regulator